ncbi:hypothetical protein Tco_0479446 [Tanacetum coccineum]
MLDALALTPFYRAFLITADVPTIYMQEFWATVSVHKSSIRFTINKKKVSLDVDMFREFIQDLGHIGDITYLTDVNVDYLHQPWRAFATVINKHEDTQVYGTILPKELTNQAMLESNAYKTYYAFASGEKAPKPKYVRKKADPDTSPKQKPVQATKGTRLKSKAKVAKPDKKKQPAKKPKAKGLAVLSEVALTEAEQLKLATKRSKTQFHSSHASGSGDGVDTQSKVPDEQQQKTSGTDEGTDEDDENDYDDLSDEGDDDNDGNDGDDGDDDANDDDKQEDDDTNDDDEETDSDRIESDRIKIPIMDQSTIEFYEGEEENIDDEEIMYDDEDVEVTKELYKDVNVNLGNEDTEMTNADQGATDQQNVSQQSGFEQVEEDSHLLNLKNPSLADNEITSLMETSARHATTVLENTSGFTTTIPPPLPLFNPLQQEAIPTPTPTTSKTTTSLPAILDFGSVFKFNERVFNLEKDVSKIKQVDQYAQALSSIPTIVDLYMDNKLREAINKAILAHNLDCKQEAQDEKNAYIELVDTSMRALIKEEVNTQLPQILPQAVSDFANPVIEKNVTESVEAAVLTRPSSQPMSTYEAAASLSEFELTEILIDKMEKNKSYDKADYKKKLYDALVESYNTDKDLFDSYGEVFSLKRSRDDSDKD